MRLLNLLLVGLCIGGLAVGAFLLGTKVERDANEGLTPTVPGEVAAATADSNLKPALYAANAFYVDHSTYEGMTADVLRKSYNASLTPALEVSDASASGFCVEVEVSGQTFSYVERGGSVQPGNGC